MKGTVYKCTFSDGKVYIGKSRHAQKRMLEHLNKTTGLSNPGFYEAYQRLGKPKFEILFEEDFNSLLDCEVTICSIEEYYISFFNATDPIFGYNRRAKSIIGPNVRKPIEQKIKELTHELLKERLKLYNQVVKKLWVTKEPLTKEDLFFVKKKYRKENIFQNLIDSFDFDDYNNNTEYELESLLDDGIYFIKHIIEVDTEKQVTDYVYSNSEQILKEAYGDKIILKLSLDGEVLGEYLSINEIAEEFNIVRADNVRNVLRHKQKTAYGYNWMYKKDYLEKKDQGQ